MCDKLKFTNGSVVYTGYYAKLKDYNGYKAYSISNSKPKGINIDIIKEFIPSWDIVKGYKDGSLTVDEYTILYRSELDSLDKERLKCIINTLLECNSVLLCYEKSDNFCHRHILGKWLEEHTNIKVHEL